MTGSVAASAASRSGSVGVVTGSFLLVVGEDAAGGWVDRS
jgi:hypothetical protein